MAKGKRQKTNNNNGHKSTKMAKKTTKGQTL